MRDTTILTVDDELLALRRLKLLLGNLPAVRHVGEATGCEEAIRKIDEIQPDIVLLDIKMRDGTGFDLLEKLQPPTAPAVIFVSAFSHYAARAFDKRAVDYVLKPVECSRLADAIDRARENLEIRNAGEQIAELKRIVAALRESTEEDLGASYEKEFWIRERVTGFVRVPVDAVRFVTSEDDYVRLHTSNCTHLMRGSIRSFENRVDPGVFTRVHRKALVRLSLIREVRKPRMGPQEVVLTSGERIRVGRVYAKKFRESIVNRSLENAISDGSD